MGEENRKSKGQHLLYKEELQVLGIIRVTWLMLNRRYVEGPQNSSASVLRNFYVKFDATLICSINTFVWSNF